MRLLIESILDFINQRHLLSLKLFATYVNAKTDGIEFSLQMSSNMNRSGLLAHAFEKVIIIIFKLKFYFKNMILSKMG